MAMNTNFNWDSGSTNTNRYRNLLDRDSSESAAGSVEFPKDQFTSSAEDHAASMWICSFGCSGKPYPPGAC